MDQRHDFAAEPGLEAGKTAAFSRRTHVLSRRVRRRARLDAVLVVAATAGGAWLGQASAGAGAGGESLMGATAALGLGILFYVVRRDRDLSRFAAQARWRERAVEGKGVTLSDWKDGAALEPWPRRRPAEPGRPG